MSIKPKPHIFKPHFLKTKSIFDCFLHITDKRAWINFNLFKSIMELKSLYYIHVTHLLFHFIAHMHSNVICFST